MTPPLAKRSISLRLYPHDLSAAAIVDEIQLQAQLAERAGFDGVMLSEHHGGYANYVPNPLLAATWVLDATDRIWAAPCPQLLPLRPVSQIVEDLAWTAARFPGRVGAGFAAGALPLDFELAGVPFDEMNDRFKATLPEVSAALQGRAAGALAADRAVRSLADDPIPVVSAAQSPAAAHRAVACSIGLLFDSIVSIQRAAEVSRVHAEHGGQGPRIMLRRVWLGDPPLESVSTQMERFREAAPRPSQAHWAPDGGLVAARDPLEICELLDEQVRASGCDALNVRVFQAGTAPEVVREQIERIGVELLPRLRELAASWG